MRRICSGGARTLANEPSNALKDVLKARGCRWKGEATAAPWYIDVGQEQREAEMTLRRTEIYRGEIDLLISRVDAYDRFSERV